MLQCPCPNPHHPILEDLPAAVHIGQNVPPFNLPAPRVQLKVHDREIPRRHVLTMEIRHMEQLVDGVSATELGVAREERRPQKVPEAPWPVDVHLSLIHISEPTRLLSISYAVFCLKKKKRNIS
eukprot:TRINITY_DN21267_c0_g1_i2.p1 TRINITY_DN21267_c0_g1~~TRINITY_DN21267_c0_g1_i2.p1  ORF type:complete len:124 (+),score=28.03 TRINITY_DN21267_c0_g1_i2:472-843(+)